MKQITIKKLKGPGCPMCKEIGYFQIEEGTTYFQCYSCGYKMIGKNYRDKIKEQK